MGLWFREWLKVGTAVALLGGLLWLVLKQDVGLPALLKSAAWGVVVWIAGGLIWIGLRYDDRREAAREWSRINRVTSSGFSPVNRAPRTGSAGSTATARTGPRRRAWPLRHRSCRREISCRTSGAASCTTSTLIRTFASACT